MKTFVLSMTLGISSLLGMFEPGVIYASSAGSESFAVIEIVKGYYRKNGTYVAPHYRGPSYPNYGF